ncbi:MAG: shikimate dehydrogenase family protein [Crocinitomicaceae bacterium]
MKYYGLIGKSLGHSFSKGFFTSFFEKNDTLAEYHNIEVAEEGMLQEVLCNKSYAGFNVTIPYKEAIIPFLDELSIEAKEIGAVNTIQVVEGKCVGHNTDAHGFHQSIKPFLRNIHERAIVFGDGGAAKAVKYVLNNLGIDVISVVRNKKLDEQFTYDEVNDYMMSVCKLVINTTPVGTYPDVDDALPIPMDQFGEDHLVVDLIYNPSRTVLLKKAEESGSMVVNGEAMLHAQALKAWEIWNS